MLTRNDSNSDSGTLVFFVPPPSVTLGPQRRSNGDISSLLGTYATAKLNQKTILDDVSKGRR